MSKNSIKNTINLLYYKKRNEFISKDKLKKAHINYLEKDKHK